MRCSQGCETKRRAERRSCESEGLLKGLTVVTFNVSEFGGLTDLLSSAGNHVIYEHERART